VNPNYKILIVEPSIIVQKGISSVIKSIDISMTTICSDSLYNSLKISPDTICKIILVNPTIFNNCKNALNKFSTHFQGMPLIGLISTYYNRNLCSSFVDCIYLNDERNTIENIITKHLTLKNETKGTPDNRLSEREIEVLKLLVSGRLNKEIAEILFISIHTVVTHRKNISTKLDVKSTAAMAIYAVANNIIDLNDSLKSIK
jgi:DNA-binding CsgD family transcriptional regulator